MPHSGIVFQESSPYTLGVEWEFALVDQTTRDLVNCADRAITAIHEHNPDLVEHIHKEFLLNTIEFVTGICHSTSQAVGQLREFINRALPVLADHHVQLCGSGTHPFARWNAALLTQNARYEEMLNRTQWWGRQMLIWGAHVHVGMPCVGRVMHVISALLTYYPHLLALSASSPMWEAECTGYASNRAMLFQQLPTAGLPFHFHQWREFEEFVHDQMTVGVIDHINEIRWDIRPVPGLGTIEVRVSDSFSRYDELAAVTALTQCLIAWLDQRLAAGEQLDQLKPWQVQENKWRAARYGLHAIIITDSHNTEQLLETHLHATLEQLEPIAWQLGCLTELHTVMDIYRRGASSQRQVQVLNHTHGDYKAVVDSIVNELT